MTLFSASHSTFFCFSVAVTEEGTADEDAWAHTTQATDGHYGLVQGCSFVPPTQNLADTLQWPFYT